MGTTAELQAENAKLRKRIADAPQRQENQALMEANQKLTEQVQRLKDEQASAQFMERVEAHCKQHACSRAEAVDACVDQYPDLHARMTRRAE